MKHWSNPAQRETSNQCRWFYLTWWTTLPDERHFDKWILCQVWFVRWLLCHAMPGTKTIAFCLAATRSKEFYTEHRERSCKLAWLYLTLSHTHRHTGWLSKKVFSFLLVAPQNRAGWGDGGGKGVNFLLSSSINNGCAVEGVRLQRDLLIRGLVGAPQAITVLQLHGKKTLLGAV